MAICRGSTPSSLVLIFSLIVYRQFHLQFFLFEALFRFYTSGALFDKLGPFIMEPHKRAKYSKSLDPDEIEKVLLDEDSDEEGAVCVHCKSKHGPHCISAGNVTLVCA